MLKIVCRERLDLNTPNTLVAATPPPAYDSRVVAILSSLGQTPKYNGAWIFANSESLKWSLEKNAD